MKIHFLKISKKKCTYNQKYFYKFSINMLEKYWMNNDKLCLISFYKQILKLIK